MLGSVAVSKSAPGSLALAPGVYDAPVFACVSIPCIDCVCVRLVFRERKGSRKRERERQITPRKLRNCRS